MSSKDVTELLKAVAVVVAGVLVAGAVMSKLRGELEPIAIAHDGFDS